MKPYIELFWLHVCLIWMESRMLAGGRGNRKEDWVVPHGLSPHRSPLVHSVLLADWPAQHWPHVPVLPHLVRQPLHHVHPGQVCTVQWQTLQVDFVLAIFFISPSETQAGHHRPTRKKAGIDKQINQCSFLRTNVRLWHAKWMSYAPNLWPVHHWDAQDLSCAHFDLTSLQRITTLVSAWQQAEHWKSLCKCCVSCGKQLCWWFGCLIAPQHWSAKQSDLGTSLKQQGRHSEILIFVFRKCWDSWHFMWPFETTCWPPERKEIKFPHYHLNCDE